MNIGSEFERNLKLSELQKKVDDLDRLYGYAVELRASNRHQLKMELDWAEKKLNELLEGG